MSVFGMGPRVFIPLALLLVLAGIPLSLAVFGGRSEAAFSASRRLGENQLTTATADLRVGDSATVLTADNMVPGDQRRMRLGLSNAGSLPLLVSVSISSDEVSPLAQELAVSVLPAAGCDESIPAPASSDEPIRLGVGESSDVCVVAALPVTASNRVQGDSGRYTIVVNGVHDVASS